MASVIREPNGRKRIEFMNTDGSRPRIRLGEASKSQAEAVKVKVEALISAKITLAPVDDEVSRWLAALPDVMHSRLVAVGLAKPRQVVAIPSHTFADLYAAFFQTLNVKSSTLIAYKQGADSLRAYFGESKPVREITPLDAARWQQTLRDEGLAEATVAKRTSVAKAMFERAVDWEMVVKTPFKKVRPGSQTNKARMFFVSEEISQKVLNACPDAEWRVIFSLARYGGLRTPF